MTGLVVSVDRQRYPVSADMLEKFRMLADTPEGDVSSSAVLAMKQVCLSDRKPDDRIKPEELRKLKELFIYLLFERDMRPSQIVPVSSCLGNDVHDIATYAARQRNRRLNLSSARHL